MEEGLIVFKNDFLSYVYTLDLLEDDVVSFGDMRFDYDLYLSDGKFFLTIYRVALDHYGMPYRNSLESNLYIFEKAQGGWFNFSNFWKK